MGWFSSIVDSAVSVVKTVAQTASDLAKKAVAWVADNGEKVIDSVKNVYSAAKPYLEKSILWLDRAADLIPWPFVKIGVKAGIKILAGLMALENSPILKKIEISIRWVIERCKNLKDKFTSTEEFCEAAEHSENLDKAMDLIVEKEDRATAGALKLIVDFDLLSSEIDALFDSDLIKSFDHYARLSVVRKLLKKMDAKLRMEEYQYVENCDEEFIVKAGKELLKLNPTLAEADLSRLSNLTQQVFNKNIQALVMEELVNSWLISLNQKKLDYDALISKLSKDEVLLRRFKRDLENGDELEKEDMDILYQIEKSIPIDRKKLEELQSKIQSTENYIYASEGFLMVISGDEFFEGESAYLLDGAIDVAQTIINAMKNGIDWNDLSTEGKFLVVDFANIFKLKSKERAEQLVSVEV
ncbi:hypothetical protein [Cellvibrio sp. QJXJ]|uniref:hypothetical protein n=1 Tax=Cellvibrio sp. QJXJ TaxID=2964606 RepID=UPI0021C41221|nr:hypothetical protein [Cellvibrio sp. QJXJ]UUA71346.1 hypothetical protein NNX04_13095 [Cellvibrio sp. QJXJ]